MANVKISQLPAATVPLTGTEVYPLVQGGITAKAVVSVPFLTPSMFGAVGDGSTDDTSAVTSAFASAASLKRPLLVTGGAIYAIDSVPLVSNLTVLGDGNTVFKLKNNAAGSVFVWPPAATTDNVTFRDLILDGNFANQAGAPHNLIHSIFAGQNSSVIVTNSEFSGLYAHDIDGMLFGTLNGASINTYNDCIFRDIKVVNFTQTCVSLTALRCLLEHLYLNNAANTNVPFSGQGNAYGMAVAATNCGIRGIKVALSTTQQTQAGGGTIGIAITNPSSSQGFNVVDSCDVDSGGTPGNFGYSFDTGQGNKVSNLISRNCIFNSDYEFFAQTDLQASNLASVGVLGSAVGIIWRDITNGKLDGYSFRGTAYNEEAMFTQGTINGLEISNYVIDTTYSAIRASTGKYVKLLNGVVKNCVNAFDNIGASTATDWTIDGLDFDGGIAPGSFPWQIENLSRVTIANFNGRNLSSKLYVQNSCTDVRFRNIQGVDFARQSLGVGSVRALCGDFDGGRACVYYNFATHGGSIGAHPLGVTLPVGAIVTRVYTLSSTTFASGTNTAQVSIGVANTVGAFVAPTVITNARFIAGNPFFGIMDGTVLANYFYNNPEQQIVLNISVEAVTAGMIQIVVDYDMNAF